MTEDAVRSMPTTLIDSWTVTRVDQLASVRSLLGDALSTSVASPDDPHRSPWQNIVLVASELTANALEHAGGPARLDVVRDGGAVTVSVMDRSPDQPPVLSLDREIGAGGFGLQLTMKVADDVGWYRTPDGAKHVWARFAMVPRPAVDDATEPQVVDPPPPV
ncbi:ATP-binding protein [Isoptericola halotolerans]|uniref:ATP-binding protein n=1 Tax=Isoptericola halotolerans TaxID=300560 RepID=UPI0038907D3E